MLDKEGAHFDRLLDSYKEKKKPLKIPYKKIASDFVIIGKGKMHCWGAMEFVPEAKAGVFQGIEIMRKEKRKSESRL